MEVIQPVVQWQIFLLKDYLNVGGVVIFHDILSWPTVAQALHVMWHDIHYYVKWTAGFFGFDIRKGLVGLAAFERTADEWFLMMEINVLAQNGKAPIAHVAVEIPSIHFKGNTGSDGKFYVFLDVKVDTSLIVSHPEFNLYESVLGKSTAGDYNSVNCYLQK